jgi:hypothetical protein
VYSVISPLPSSVVAGEPSGAKTPPSILPIWTPVKPACDSALKRYGTRPGPFIPPFSSVSTRSWRLGFAPAWVSASTNV